jgi:prepilin signal peptidase PulO-like enzyme (type II secretory pathway)
MKAIAAVLPGRDSVPTRLAVQLAVVALAAGCLARFGASTETATAVFFVSVLVVLSAIDIERRLLPNVILLPATGVLFVAQVALFPERAVEFALSGLGAGLFMLLLVAAYPQGMGMGDVKLALFLGVGLGSSVGFALLAGALAASFASVGLLMYYGSAARKMTIPFGPFLALGAIFALFDGYAPFVG